MRLAALFLAGASLFAAVDYQRDIRPLLAKRCVACHGPDEHARMANLRLDQPVPQADRILARVTDDKRPMPPAGPRLKSEEIGLIREWIGAGAPFSSHWSFEAPKPAARPTVRNAAWPRSEIDYFVLARLEKEGLAPSPEADAYTLARRAALDLTGLPPEPALAEAFVKDKSPGAYERLIDALLASPRYGERWARVWLDLARYADTQGYEKDNRRTIWPYRDWVIRAFNANVPFDRFSIAQIAGDLLPEPSEDDLIATGFHRNTMTNTEGGTDDEEFRDAAIKDRVATTGLVWMGLSFGCAQCHTHKYDPISHKEFYQIYGFYNQSQDSDKADDSPTLKLDGASTLVMRDLAADKARVTRIHERGNFLSPGAEVQAGVLGSFHTLPADAPKNRLGLARWLVDKSNPLTARVQVNRYWARLFGAGLVESEEDFGTQGTPPEHRETLDWLASEYMRLGWDTKALLKTIAMSATYRQSSAVAPALMEKDPRNRLLARGARFRLDAEVVRDQALAASGLLSAKMYGPPVMPWQPEGIWTVVYNSEKWETSAGEDRYRRGLYTFLRRTSPYPSMIAYDAPTGETCTVRRIRTNTPLQALATLNDPVSMEAAQKLAARTLAESSASDIERAEHMFKLLLVRPPTREELRRIVALHKDAAAEIRANAASQNTLLHYDRAMYPADREAVWLPRTADWRYTVSEPAEGWREAGFDATGWSEGKGQFGQFKESKNPPKDARIGTDWDSDQLWLRAAFEASEVPAALRLLARSSCHFEAWINGVPATSTNLERGDYYEYALSKDALASLKPGRNVLAVRATRSSERSVGQLFDASLVAVLPLGQGRASSGNARRAAWVVVANTLMNLDEALTRR